MNSVIRTRPYPTCYLCGGKGAPLYSGLVDYLFQAPGTWSMQRCSRHGCDLLWLDPIPTEEDIGKAYQHYGTHRDADDDAESWTRRIYNVMREGYLARAYGYNAGAVPAWKKFFGLLLYLHPAQRANLDFSVMYLPAQPGARLLEVGCGSGRMLKIMQDLGWESEGIDFDPDAVRNAVSKGLRVRVGDLVSQGYPDESFDVITLSHLIEHVHDPRALLRECYRLLKPKGTLVIVTPNSKSFGHSIFKSNWRGLEPPRHLHIFSMKSLQELVAPVGFQITRIRTSIRGANWIFAASGTITNRARRRNAGLSMRLTPIWSRGLQLLEWMLLKARPTAGEETTLFARKP
jgi:2-polyprenyl-3-methyl-5-hydroxy-6-metoxy-1,4-benzoquinol methylase